MVKHFQTVEKTERGYFILSNKVCFKFRFDSDTMFMILKAPLSLSYVKGVFQAELRCIHLIFLATLEVEAGRLQIHGQQSYKVVQGQPRFENETLPHQKN